VAEHHLQSQPHGATEPNRKMKLKGIDVLILGVSLVWLSMSLAVAEETPAAPHAVQNPLSPLMLAGDWVPDDPRDRLR
jgi:hypothetical protein